MRQGESVERFGRHLSVVGFIAVAIAWLAVIRVVGLLTEGRADLEDGRILTVEQVLWTFIVPLGAGCLFVYGVIAALGWWRSVVHDPKPVRRWVWVIPAIFALVIVAGINYGGLADRGLGFTLVLLAAAMLIGFGEEGLFRAIGVTAFRQNGYSEAKVALWTSALFGLAHVANVIAGDARALVQALVVAFAGYFFYLIRRVSRSNILNSVLHGLFDFMLISSTVILTEGEDIYLGGLLGIVAYVACGLVLLIRRHRIEPAVA